MSMGTLERRALTSIFLALLAVSAVAAQEAPRERWWLSARLGGSQVRLSSDQRPEISDNCFSLGFNGGWIPLPWLRVGVDLGGWLFEAYDVHDPAHGESLTAAMLIAQVKPFHDAGLLLTAGAGSTQYENNHPNGFDSSGTGWRLAAGYEFRVGQAFAITPELAYSAGTFGDVNNPLIVETGREFSAWDLTLGFTWFPGAGRAPAR